MMKRQKMVNLKKSSNNFVDNQIEKLTQISEEMAHYITLRDYDHINHLDKIRKKIILDIERKKTALGENNKNNILQLIKNNNAMAISLKEKTTNDLNEIIAKKKCTNAYRKNIF
ncbi:hypothetical protein OA848_02925 [Rickettsiales bacterium]|nr:hypothetical protein [Rickettsiales bacterium]